MKFLTLLTFAIAAKGFAVELTASTKMSCEKVKDQAVRLQSVFAKLTESESDYDKGYELQPQAFVVISRFANISSADPCRESAWMEVVRLAKQQAPYDEDSQGAYAISQYIAKDRSRLLEPFKRAIADPIFNVCRGSLLKNIVEEKLCKMKKTPGIKDSQEPMDQCPSIFDYRACIRAASIRTENETPGIST